MLVIGFDGRPRKLKFSNKKRAKCSSYHAKARDILKKLFPYEVCYEEVSLAGSKTHRNDNLYADFLLPRLKIVVEVQGEGHYEFNNHFHKSIVDFNRSKLRDEVKREWCELNNLILIELKFNESELWKDQIRERL